VFDYIFKRGGIRYGLDEIQVLTDYTVRVNEFLIYELIKYVDIVEFMVQLIEGDNCVRELRTGVG